ncbi:hypothetical protein [Flavobacterium sp. ABG]|uniref:hypothetical protein n=1 Tax=Flavobacterium sp. ABG TaxID=1423322 RepID=UPI00064A8260|nr:hypothetical protein [Flavobacterium sp. ABG]KLT69908.1 hypothetical protein AB674_09390 [Flavobacterium sp. ABG]
MRAEILKTLVQAKEMYATITNEYGNVLPENILNSAHATIDSNIPKFVNNFLHVLNDAVKQNIYSENNNIDEAIEVFSNPDLDVSIQSAINSKTYLATDGARTFNTTQILEQCVDGVHSGLVSLSSTLMAGRITKR